MASLTCETIYQSIGCNRVPHCVHWGNNGQIAFGTCNSVALASYSDDGIGPIQAMLNGHKDRVNCVRFMEEPKTCPGNEKETGRLLELVSGASDGSLVVWQGEGSKFISQSLSGHKGSVTSVDALTFNPSPRSCDPKTRRTLIASSSTDSTVKVWEGFRSEGGRGTEDPGGEEKGIYSEKQTISFGSGFALDITLGVFSGSWTPLLAIGGDDCKVHLYTEAGGMFTRVQSLAGHEDWIRGIEMCIDDSGDVLLASCAQDCFIRLWRISEQKAEDSSTGQTKEIQLKKNIFTVSQGESKCNYTVALESVLAGHEQWIYAVHWQRPILTDTGDLHQPLCLLSASMDKTMIVWRFDQQNAMWMDEVRVGEVGGNTLGLFGCQFSPDGHTILAHGYQGAFHVWTKHSPSEHDQGQSVWTPSVVVSGHFSGVQDMAWNPDGHFLLSVGVDQTTRLHAPWKRGGKETWHEIARPQIHGYDMQCLAMIGRYAFVSGADEKVLRVFEAPTNFLDNLAKISGVDILSAKAEQEAKNVPEGASVPALGLSNKAVFQGDGGMPNAGREINHPSEQYPEIYFAPVSLHKPPTEDHLLQNSLWPETQKLYGHGYEVFSVATHPNGSVIASACKASKPDHAAIILWDTSSWQQRGQLTAHSLTVTQLAFSPSGQFLLSVSRDRTWALFEETKESDISYQLVARTDKKTSVHSRIIWACSWSHDDKVFATASRDKKVIVWGKRQNSDECPAPSSPLGHYQALSTPLDAQDSATAVDFSGQLASDGSYMLAVGVESGGISVHSWSLSQPESWRCLYSFPKHLSHTLTVKRLRWRPTPKERGNLVESRKNQFQLASCSSDGSVRIHTFSDILMS